MHFIDPRIAQQIVHEMKSILKEEINFMDSKGIIIASTDEARCGHYHEAAAICVSENRDVFVMADDEYAGARKGANMPIRYDGKIVGVIGITGEVSAVSKHIEILRRMTEVLIRESFAAEILSVRYENFRLAISQMLEGVHLDQERDSGLFQVLGIDPKVPRVVIFLLLEHGPGELDRIQRINRTLLSIFMNDKQSIFASDSNGFIIFARWQDKNSLEDLIEEIKRELFSHRCYAGVSHVVSNGMGYKEALKLAEIAAVSARFQKIPYLLTSDLKIELILSTLPQKVKDTFKERILGNLSSEERVYYSELIELFAKHNGSIRRVADDLFIHRNTLQYQLNKLNKLVGLDMRNYDDYMALRMALTLNQLGN